MVSFSPQALAAVSGSGSGGGAALIGPSASTAVRVKDLQKGRGDQGPRATVRVAPVRRSQRGAARRSGEQRLRQGEATEEAAGRPTAWTTQRPTTLPDGRVRNRARHGKAERCQRRNEEVRAGRQRRVVRMRS